jgi:UDP-2,4-diacetamido-2,4,6-trideoxy-beta-L-altropyranose hydrolase
VRKGFKVNVLPFENNKPASDDNRLFHSNWLGVSQLEDAMQCQEILHHKNVDWLIVDHYALDKNWEQALKNCYKKLMVIDDLSDREHICDLLLDQTYGREPDDYKCLVPETCNLLIGSQFALLRPEFSNWRQRSLERRAKPVIKKIMITMGGIDTENITGQILAALNKCELPRDIEIIVVLGSSARFLDQVMTQAKVMNFKTMVLVNVNNMAEIMTNSDIAIGAAGTTTWERCCMGLPSLIMVLAKNQQKIADLITKSNAAIIMDVQDLEIICEFINKLINQIGSLIKNSSEITDGSGAKYVSEYIL